MKSEILEKICYTELVYGRINKKLGKNFSKKQIEKKVYDLVLKTSEKQFKRVGKNIYISNFEEMVRLTINSNTFRIITADRIFREQP
jgi:hypothetical protein